MAETKYLEESKVVFNTLCRALDKNDWKYKKNEEELKIECGAQGDDLAMEISVEVDAERRVVFLFSHLPFSVSEDKRLDVAVAVSAINNMLVDGSFDFDITRGHMFFRMTNSFIESTLGEDVFMYMLLCSCQTIDDYNDKLLMLAKGMMSLEQFLTSIND